MWATKESERPGERDWDEVVMGTEEQLLVKTRLEWSLDGLASHTWAYGVTNSKAKAYLHGGHTPAWLYLTVIIIKECSSESHDI